MGVSHLARSIAESPTLKLNEEARILKERGESVVHLGIGEPKNKAPITAILSSVARLSGGDIKYTPTDGIPSLKKAIIRYTEETYDRLVAPENVIVSSGAKQSRCCWWNCLPLQPDMPLDSILAPGRCTWASSTCCCTIGMPRCRSDGQCERHRMP